MSPPKRSPSISMDASSTPLRQTSLSFPSKRPTRVGEKALLKGKGTSSKSSTVPNTPKSKPSTPIKSYIDVDEDTESRPGLDPSREKREGPVKRRKLAAASDLAQPANSKELLADRSQGVFKSREGIENASGGKAQPDNVTEGLPTLSALEKSGRLKKPYGEAKAKMGGLEPIHAKGLRPVHHILRVFDLSDDYGPCIGVSRLERWERAAALGLNPPPEVKEILTTKEGADKKELKECVFYGEV